MTHVPRDPSKSTPLKVFTGSGGVSNLHLVVEPTFSKAASLWNILQKICFEKQFFWSCTSKELLRKLNSRA